MHGTIVYLVAGALAASAFWRALGGDAGADPAKWLLHQLGLFAVFFLVATLSVSPLRRRLGRPALLRWRRPLGLAAFALVCAHLLVYLTFYQGLALAPIIDDIVKRPYILIGVLAWLLLLPLAITSTRAMQKRLGSRWATLHRAIYAIVPLALMHHGMAQKADLQTVVWLSLATAILLLERAWHARRP